VPSKSKSKLKRSLQIESLESRLVPTTASLSGGTLAVTGSNSADTISVVLANGRISVTGVKIQYSGQSYASVGVSSVTKVYVDGRGGDDVIDISTITKPATIIGGDGNDSITGGLGANSIFGRAGDDTIVGGPGNDLLEGEDGNNSITGGAGNDTIYAGTGNDNVDGGTGNDSIFAVSGNDSIQGGDGNDTIFAGTGTISVDGGAGDDQINGGTGNDSLTGGAGNDTIHGGNGDDSINGGDGDDLIYGENGNDSLHGGAGNDIIAGGAGSDFVFGDDGDDVLSTSDLPEVINGGTGNDTISAGSGDVVDGGGGTDTIVTGNGGDNSGGGSGGGNNGGGTGGGTSTTGSVLQTIRSQWSNGTTNDITVRNTGTHNMNGWTVEFDADFNITEIWNAQIVSHTGTHYVISNIPNFWNTTIAPNTQIVFGFNTSLNPGDSTAIRSIILNGTALTDTTPTPPTPDPTSHGTVTQAIRSQWSNGTTNDITIKNTGTSTMKGWTITFTADFQVTDVWNAVLVGHTGNTWTISNIPGFWNTNIAPGASIVIGFNTLLSSGNSTAISNVTLNGNPA
jgi:hypothetical protein